MWTEPRELTSLELNGYLQNLRPGGPDGKKGHYLSLNGSVFWGSYREEINSLFYPRRSGIDFDIPWANRLREAELTAFLAAPLDAKETDYVAHPSLSASNPSKNMVWGAGLQLRWNDDGRVLSNRSDESIAKLLDRSISRSMIWEAFNIVSSMSWRR